jgi:molybdate transport system substrate-binding protein
MRKIMPLAVEINVLSGAAIEPALIAAADVFRDRTGNKVNIKFATTPEIRRLVGAGETPDVAIAPPATLDELAKLGKIDRTARVSLGQVGVGIVIRDGAPCPDVSTTDALKRAVLEADSVVYNRASSGLYVEGLMQRLGLAELIQARQRQGDRLHARGSNSALSWQRPATRRSAACRNPKLHDLCRGTRTRI